MSSLLHRLASITTLCLSCCSAPVFGVSNAEPQALFSGLYINDKEYDGADLFQAGERYWLPLEQLGEWAQVHVEQKDRNYLIHTPLGSAIIASDNIRELEQRQHIALDALSEAGIQGRFDQRSYALKLYAPWIGLAPKTAALSHQPQAPDYHPPQAGLSRVYNRLDASYSDYSDSSALYSDALGYLANGVWGLQINTDSEQNSELKQLYWHTFDRYAAMRLGTASSSPGPYLNAQDFSGLQLGFSNQSIYTHLASNTSVSRQMFNDDASYSHDISGEGPKGGIAELRLNERPIARVRIALDGRYLFKRLPLSNTGGDKVEVALYEYSLAQPPIELVDYSIANKPRAVSTGELMLSAGIGTQGSTLQSSADGPLLGYTNMRYGLNNRLTLEAGHQSKAEDDDGWYLGAIASFGPALAASLGRAREGEKETTGAEIWGQWNRLQANYDGRLEQTLNSEDLSEKHNLSVDWQLNTRFSVLARGLLSKEQERTTDAYLAPGFRWKMNRRNTLAMRPTSADDYDARFTHRALAADANFQLRATRNTSGLGINYAYNAALSLGFDYALHNKDARTLSAAATFRPRHNNDSVYSAQVTRQAEHTGYALAWRHRLSPRTQFNLSYHRRIDDETQLLEETLLNDKESIVLSIESELWFSKNGWRGTGVPTGTTRGALSARVFDGQGELMDSELARLKIVGAQSTLQPHSDGSQVFNNLPPGDYDLELLAKGLPIEYENTHSTYRVRVAAAATTKVDITLQAHYGVSGLLSINGKPAPHTWVDVWQGEQRVADGKTDSYGYYQVTGLQPGEYELRHAEGRIGFELVDDYLFDINLATGAQPPKTQALSRAHKTPNLPFPERLHDVIDLGSALPSGISGRVMYRGEPLGHTSVQLQTQGRKIANVISDRYGFYSFHHLPPGDYSVSVGRSLESYRVGSSRVYDANITLDEHSVVGDNSPPWSMP